MARELKTLKSLTCAIRDIRSKEYIDSILKVQQELGLENYPQAKIEIMLIEATKECFLKDGDNEENRLKVDAVLVDFGLLKGYDNRNRHNKDTEAKYTRTSITKRREKFLKESTCIKKWKINQCKAYRDLYNKNNLEKGVSSLASSTCSKIDEVAKHIHAKRRDIKSYIEKVVKGYNLLNLEYLEETMLPELSSKRQDPVLGDMSVADCINSIRFSEHHDDVAKDLYSALCNEEASSNHGWVKSWLIECIQEKFRKTMDRDILFASFALLEDYELEGQNGLKRRLNQYLSRSIYVPTHPSISRRTYDSIIEQPERNQIMEGLQKKEQELVDELVVFVNTSPKPKEYMRDFAQSKKHDTKRQVLFFSNGYAEAIEYFRKLLPVMSLCVIGILFSTFLSMRFSSLYIQTNNEQLLVERNKLLGAWEQSSTRQDLLQSVTTRKNLTQVSKNFSRPKEVHDFEVIKDIVLEDS